MIAILWKIFFIITAIESIEAFVSTDHIIQKRQSSGSCSCVPAGQCKGSVASSMVDPRIVNIPTSNSPTSCMYGLQLCCQPTPYQCGQRYSPLPGVPTFGPDRAPYGAYPWVAAILTQSGVFIGSGVLINNLHVLTVAHKVYQNPANTMVVRLGEWDAASQIEPIPPQSYNVNRVFINPNYNSLFMQNDVAILRLSRPVQLGMVPTIATACLTPSSFAGATCWVSGWGKNDFGANGLYQSIMKQVDLPVRSPADCQARLRATRLGTSYVFDSYNYICAGGQAGKDACTGDGGAPLVCSDGIRWYVVGLVAWGIGCGTSDVPGVYVNVGSFIPFIQQAVTTP